MVTHINTQLANAFFELAAFHSDDPQPFKAVAYRRVAQLIQEYPTDITLVGEVADLKKLPGIGDAIASKIVEWRDTGSINTLENFRKQHGGIAVELLAIEGLGPKRVKFLQEQLHIASIAELIAAAEANKLTSLDGFDTVLEQKLLQNARQVTARNTRFERKIVQPTIEKLLADIRNLPGVTKAEVAGSYRRKRDTIGDVDVLVVSDDRLATIEAIVQHPLVVELVAKGDTKVSFDLQNGLRTDVRCVEPKQWGSALLYFTGSREHNIMMRKAAIAKGYKLNEYGLFDADDNVIAQETEADVYKALDLKFVEPSKRVS